MTLTPDERQALIMEGYRAQDRWTLERSTAHGVSVVAAPAAGEYEYGLPRGERVEVVRADAYEGAVAERDEALAVLAALTLGEPGSEQRARDLLALLAPEARHARGGRSEGYDTSEEGTLMADQDILAERFYKVAALPLGAIVHDTNDPTRVGSLVRRAARFWVDRDTKPPMVRWDRKIDAEAIPWWRIAEHRGPEQRP